MSMFDLAQSVKRGVRLLDRKVPRWRRVMREHQDQYDFKDGEHCILGTLEHFSGRMAVLKKRGQVVDDYAYNRGRLALGLRELSDAVVCGFDAPESDARDHERAVLHDLWRAEFEPIYRS